VICGRLRTRSASRYVEGEKDAQGSPVGEAPRRRPRALLTEGRAAWREDHGADRAILFERRSSGVEHQDPGAGEKLMFVY
jgi:hypothetical protein